VGVIAVLSTTAVVSGRELMGQGVGASSPSAAMAFEVASIRLNTSGSGSGGGGPRPGGRYTYTNMPVRALVASAFRLPSDRVLGGPGWITTDRYDISATGKENPTADDISAMMLALLRDRFRLEAHREMRDLPVYSLVQARPDKPLGSGLRRSAVDCRDPEQRKKAYASAPAGAREVCGLTTTAGLFTGGGVDLSTLTVILTSAAGRPVLDRTGLTGGFDIDLKWSAMLQPDTADAVSIFTAVQEQLGLKLESGTAPLGVIVIDRLERPSDN